MSRQQTFAQCVFARWRRRWAEVVSGRDTRLSASITRLALGALPGLYWLGLKANRALYTSGAKRRTQPALPVISVGNLTLGGTGKTTTVRFLARRLQEEGLRPAVVLRGYQAHPTQRAVVLAGRDNVTLPEVAEVGDEARLLAQVLPGVKIGVGKRREVVIAKLAEETGPQVALLDDGFQYFRMNKLVDIVLLDATVDLSRQRLFPAGYLREPLAHLRRADQIWLTHSDLADESALARLRSTVQRVSGNVPVVETKHEITGLRTLSGETLELGQVEGARLLAVSAIGNAQAFEQSLHKLGAEVVPLRYEDHHYYSPYDLADIETAAREHRTHFVAITCKDAVKWPGDEIDVPVVIVDCQLRITKGEQVVAGLIDQIKQAVSSTENGK